MPRDPLLSVGRSRAAIPPQRPGKPLMSPTPQLLSTLSSVAAALGWDWDLLPFLPSRCDCSNSPPPAFLWKDGWIAKYSNACRETLSTRFRSHLCLHFLLLFRHDPPLMTSHYRVLFAYDHRLVPLASPLSRPTCLRPVLLSDRQNEYQVYFVGR